jgi:hypothetical protein
VRYSLVSRIPEWASDDVMLILRTDIGSPVGRPPFKVLPYGAVSEGCGAWEDSDDAASDESDEGPVPRVSHRVQSPIVFCSPLGPPRPASPRSPSCTQRNSSAASQIKTRRPPLGV